MKDAKRRFMTECYVAGCQATAQEIADLIDRFAARALLVNEAAVATKISGMVRNMAIPHFDELFEASKNGAQIDGESRVILG